MKQMILDTKSKMFTKQHIQSLKDMEIGTLIDKPHQLINALSMLLRSLLVGNVQRYALQVLCVFAMSFSYAQKVYPVRTSINVKYPSVFLSDYTKPTNTNISVTLLDASVPSYDVLLELDLVFESNHFKTSVPVPVTLIGGETYDLSETEIQSLFATVQPSFSAGNILPEGIYQMSVMAYDARNRNIFVSNQNTGFTTVPVMRFDPPMLTTLTDKEKVITGTAAQNLFFTWTPRHMSIDPEIRIKYKLKIVKIQNDRNPYEAINASGPPNQSNGVYLEEELNVPLFVYSPNELLLETGTTYAWQVTAYEEIVAGSLPVITSERFKNGGRSEVFTFVATEDCSQPEVILSGARLDIIYSVGNPHTEYEIGYRPAGSYIPYSYIYPPITTANITSYTFTDAILDPQMEYEVIVRAKCNSWLEPQYIGLVKLGKANKYCKAPEPVTIDKNDGTGVTLSWKEVNLDGAAPLSYKVKIYGAGAPTDFTTITKNTTTLINTAELPNVAPFQVQVISVCGVDNEAATDKLTINAGDKYLGGCGIPKPFELRVENLAGNQTKISWSHLPNHESYVFKFKRKAETGAFTIINTTLPSVIIDTLVATMPYQYTITYKCALDNNTVTSPIGYFKKESGSVVVVDPGTGNCFPPAAHRAEVRSNTSAFIEWDATEDSEEYQLFFKRVGTTYDSIYSTSTEKKAKLTNLVANAKYEYKIRCRCEGGKFSIFSEIGTFDLSETPAGDCPVVQQIKLDSAGITELRLKWAHDATYIKYELVYRDSTQSIKDEYKETIDPTLHKFTTSGVDSIKFVVANLAGATKYIFTVQGICTGGVKGRNSDQFTFMTRPDNSRGSCDKPGILCDASSTNPPPNLSTTSLDALPPEPSTDNRYFNAGELKILTKFDGAEASGSSFSADGLLNGIGYVDAPVIGQDLMRLQVLIVNAKINDKFCMLDGEVQVKGIVRGEVVEEIIDKVDELSDQVRSTINTVKDNIDKAQAALDEAQKGLDQASSYFRGGEGTGQPKQEGGSDISSVNGDQNSPASKPSIIKNGSDVYYVATDGTPTKVGSYGTAPTAEQRTLELSADSVTFDAHTAAVYAFDKWLPAYAGKRTIEMEYPEITSGNYKYHVASKLLVGNSMDKVKINFFGTATASNITFVNGSGFKYDIKGSGSNQYLDLVSGPVDDAQEILAIKGYGTTGAKTIGKLWVPTYELHERKVVLVPVVTSTPSINGKDIISRVNAAFAAAIQTKLDATYKKVGVKYTVEVDATYGNKKSYAWDDGDKALKQTGSKLTSNDYSGEEASMIEDFVSKMGTDYSTDKAYFFVIDQNEGSEKSLLGKMQFKEQFGFLYAAGVTNGDVMAKTVAHELGHGEYFLDHTFHPDIKLGDEGTTSNLMDYKADGASLLKYQWDIIHKPGHIWGVFNKDKDQALTGTSYAILSGKIDFQEKINNEQCISYLTPDGSYITLPAGIPVSFFNMVNYNNELEKLKSTLPGSVYWIKDGDKEYMAKFDASYKFEGYYQAETVGDVSRFTNPSAAYTLKIPKSTISKLVYARLNGMGNFEAICYNSAALSSLQHVSDTRSAYSDNAFYNKVKTIFTYQNTIGTTERTPSTSVYPLTNPGSTVDVGTIVRNTYTDPEIIFTQKIAFYNMLFPNLVEFSTHYYENWPPSAPARNNENRDFDHKYWSNTNDFKTNWSNNKPQFYQDFNKYYYDRIIYLQNLLRNLDYTTNPGDLVVCLQSINDQEFNNIDAAKRIIAVELILKGNYGIVSNYYEKMILKLLYSVNFSSSSSLATVLTNMKAKYHFDNTKTVLEKLIESIDDQHLGYGEDNYKELMKFLFRATLNHYKNQSTYTSLTQTNETLLNNSFSYYYYPFYERLEDFFTDNSFMPQCSQQSKVLLDNNIIKLQHLEICAGFFENRVISEHTISDVFAPIIVINEAQLPLTSDIGYTEASYKQLLADIKSKKVDLDKVPLIPVPAVVLKYIDDKVFQELVADALEFTSDLATLSTGVGPIISASTKLRKAIALADYASSAVSVSGNMLTLITGNTQVKAVTDPLSNILGIIGLGGEVSLIAGDKVIDIVRKSNGLPTNTVKWSEVDQLVLGINNTSIENMNAALDSRLKDVTITFLQKAEDDAIIAGKSQEYIQSLSNARYKLAQVAGTNIAASTPYKLGVWLKNSVGATQRKLFESFNILEQQGKLWVSKFSDGTYKVFYKKNATDDLNEIGNLNIAGTTFTEKPLPNVLKSTTKDDIAEVVDDYNSTIVCKDGTCGFNKGGCLAENTIIHSKKGLVKIQSVQVGDSLLSYDENTKSNTYSKVVNVFKKGVAKMLKVWVASSVMVLTPNHPVLASSSGSNWGYSEASLLKKGTFIIDAHGKAQKIDSIVEVKESYTVYNFELEGIHNYLVGKEGFVVHNAVPNCFGVLYPNIKQKAGADFVKFHTDFKDLPEMLEKFENGVLSIEAWRSLKGANRTSSICKSEQALTAFNNLITYPRMKNLIDAGLVPLSNLANLKGYKIAGSTLDVVENSAPFSVMCERVRQFVDVLPIDNTKIKNLDKFIGSSGFTVNSSYTIRHSLTTVERLKMNEAFVKELSEISFEVSLSYPIGTKNINTVCDVVMQKGTDFYAMETKAALGSSTENYVDFLGAINSSNFVNQIYNGLIKCQDVSRFKSCMHEFIRNGIKDEHKANVIAKLDAWESGAFYANPTIRSYFASYATSVGYTAPITSAAELKTFLSSNKDWFEDWFKNPTFE